MAIGDWVPTGRGAEHVLARPRVCANGHPLEGNVRLGWQPCLSGGHHTWTCLTAGCGDVVHRPPLRDDCTH